MSIRIHPPKGRRAWIVPERAHACGLHYISWGRRRFGQDPIPVAHQPGYVYALVLEGHPTLCFQNSQHQCGPMTAFIVHPDCAMGWTAEADGEQRILIWIWQEPPAVEMLNPPPGGFKHWRFMEDAITPLQLLHRGTRNEIARDDAYSPLAIRQKQTGLDIEFARQVDRPRSPAPAILSPLLRMALEWIEAHTASTRPVADLCDRLDCSAASITRLFKQELGTTPLQYVMERKIKQATVRLQAGESVKQVALELGYRHVHDFSRFYRAKTGIAPSRIASG